MQRSWRTDHDKLTFIICLPLPSNSEHDDTGPDSVDVLTAGLHDRDERMVGDINLFLSAPDEEPDADVNVAGLVGEVELMIALPSLQRQGFGRAALVTFMAFVLDNWTLIAREYRSGSERSAAKVPPQLTYLRVRINVDNARSIALFESIGFIAEAAGPNYFGEVELRWTGTVEDAKRLQGYEEVRVLRYVN